MYKRPRNSAYKHCDGFTLVELVVGMVVMAIALTLLSVTFFSSRGRAIDPMMQARAAEFGQALMEEILSKRFDENSPIGGQPPCTINCTTEANFGADGAETRKTFNDVDDYNKYCDKQYPLEDIEGNPVAAFDDRFTMRVCVTYAPGLTNNLKRIEINMYPPGVGGTQSPITLVAYRGNF